MMWAVLPVKDLSDAKQRLGEVLGPRERRELFRAMVEDVLEALGGAAGLDGIAVVSRDPVAAGLAHRYGARLMVEAACRGQTAAVSAAAGVLAAEGAEAVFAVPGDAPLVSAAEIERVLALHLAPPAQRPLVTIVPARDGRGSNGMACSPPEALAFQFGEDSFNRHVETARRTGVAVRALRLEGLGLDVDTPDDLAALLARPGETRAQVYLKASGIAARLGEADGADALRDRTGAGS